MSWLFASGGQSIGTSESESESEVAQLCLTLWDPMDCSLPGSSVHGIFQARILEWVAIAFSRGSSRPRDWNRVSCIVGRHFTVSINSSNEYSGLISFRIDWFDFLTVQVIFKILSSLIPQFKSINSVTLGLLYGPTLTSIHGYWKNHSFN